MLLLEYMLKRRVAARTIARRASVTPTAVTSWAYGQKEPRRMVRDRIVQITEGEVSLRELLDLDSARAYAQEHRLALGRPAQPK